MASVKVTGKMLAADFPLIARDWDPTANDRALDSIKAAADCPAHWKCHRCAYEWVAPVGRRTMRQTRCERCSTERADGQNSLAALHPALVLEWDVERNGALRPDRIKATYDKAVGWTCADDPEHPPYRMSPFTRAKRPIGCSLCHRRAKAAAARAA